MLSLREVQRAARIIAPDLEGALLRRVVQTEALRIILSFKRPPLVAKNSLEIHLLLSCHPEFSRISLLPGAPPAPSRPLAFAQYLRAHVERASCESIRAEENDRQVILEMLGREGRFQMRLCLYGPRSNIYFLDAAHNVKLALRPLQETRKDLELGQAWVPSRMGVAKAGEDRWSDLSDAGFIPALEEWYRAAEAAKELAELTRRVGGSLAKEEEYLRRKSENLQRDLRNASQAAEHRKYGELLKANLHAIWSGAESFNAIDFETGERITIPLDSALSPAENMEACFERYHKETRGAEKIRGQLDLLEKEFAGHRNLEDEFRTRTETSNDANALAGLRELASMPKVRKLLARYHPEARSQEVRPKKASPLQEVAGKMRPKRYESADGMEIWVGRSDEGNDYLTTRLARGNDLFFHLDGSPGSHVILRTAGHPDAPSESLIDACELAVHYSKQKGASRADVHVAPIKNVKKPKGAKPGLVYVTGGKTIHLRRDPKRLERLLSSRLSD